MQIAYAKVHEIVSKNPLEEGYKEIQSLVIESDNRVKSEDIVRLTGWNRISVLNVSKELERVGVVRSEAISAHNVVHAHRGGMIT